MFKSGILTSVLIWLVACSGGPRPFSQSKSIDDSRKERGRDFSTKKDVVTGMVYWDARSEQKISAAANSEVSGATVRFPLEPVERSTLASLGTGATLLTLTTLRLLELEDSTQLALSRCLYIGSEEPIDALQNFEISLPLQNETGVSEEALEKDSVVIVFRQARYDSDPNSRFTGIIPRNQFSIKDGVAKFEARYFGMYQVFFFDQPMSKELLVKTNETLLLKSDQATLLEIVESPDEIIRDTEMLPAFKLIVKNAAGEPAEKYKGQVSVRVLDESQDLLEGTKSMFATNGELVFSDLKINRTMNFVQLQFADADGLLVEAEPYSVYEKPATKIRIVTSITEQKAGIKLPVIEVQALNDEGIIDPRFKREITMVIKGGAEKATLSGTVKVRASSGVALFNDLSIDKAASGYQLAVSSSKVSGHASNEFEIKPGTPHSVKMTTQPARGNYQANISVTARVEDAYGNLTPDFVGNLNAALSANSVNASLSGSTSSTVSGGVAQFSSLRVDKPASDYKLEISGSGLVSATTDSFVIDPLAASSLSFVTQPSNSTAGAAIAPTVTIRALDTGGFIDTNYSAAISASLNPNPGSASLGGTSTGNFVAGQFSFSNLSVSAAGTGYRLRISSGSMSADSSSFDVSAASGGLWLTDLTLIRKAENSGANAKFCGGNGSLEEPFEICDAHSWNNMPSSPHSSFVLSKNIDLSTEKQNSGCHLVWPFEPETPFTGRINGRGFRVRLRCSDLAEHSPIDLSRLSGEIDDLWFESAMPSPIVLRILKDDFEVYESQYAVEVKMSESIDSRQSQEPMQHCMSEARSGFRAGDGTELNPFLICDGSDWQRMLLSEQKYFVLGADIDLFDLDICRSDCVFERLDDKRIDGRGYIVGNLSIQLDSMPNLDPEGILLPNLQGISFDHLSFAIDTGSPERISIGRRSSCSSATAHQRQARMPFDVSHDCQVWSVQE